MILNYLGEAYNHCDENCSNCRNKIRTIREDMTECAKFILKLLEFRKIDSKLSFTKDELVSLLFPPSQTSLDDHLK